MQQRGVSRAYINDLLSILQDSAKDVMFLDEFLKDLLTPGEYDALVLRWQIIKRLAKGMTQREIAKELHIGISTVTRGSREWNNPKGGFRKLLKKK
ncbi:MAG: hypothetical protein A3A33_04440 [Candidatus Yanofskybacteria bacterium RIFCSPLOWO2_01_FULL_49_25]|uniref:Transcriptional regulator n=1 Tax=Candidatus Yanofskybacteria bacterium RIFCSPLOWO2_01_FULL_49_25 TaxID=1802701 RepID=A0A1F8GWP8_9BACT|nr:MAG: hypothetical protein A3A33_04440 [Candidatus Yanofskybacteria bacterium RIFCSPLOWO2_01_FULL_49_25]